MMSIFVILVGLCALVSSTTHHGNSHSAVEIRRPQWRHILTQLKACTTRRCKVQVRLAACKKVHAADHARVLRLEKRVAGCRRKKLHGKARRRCTWARRALRRARRADRREKRRFQREARVLRRLKAKRTRCTKGSRRFKALSRRIARIFYNRTRRCLYVVKRKAWSCRGRKGAARKACKKTRRAHRKAAAHKRYAKIKASIQKCKKNACRIRWNVKLFKIKARRAHHRLVRIRRRCSNCARRVRRLVRAADKKLTVALKSRKPADMAAFESLRAKAKKVALKCRAVHKKLVVVKKVCKAVRKQSEKLRIKVARYGAQIRRCKRHHNKSKCAVINKKIEKLFEKARTNVKHVKAEIKATAAYAGNTVAVTESKTLVTLQKKLKSCWTFWCRNKVQKQIRTWFAKHSDKIVKSVKSSSRSTVVYRVKSFLHKLKVQFRTCKDNACRDKCKSMIAVLLEKSKKLHSKRLTRWVRRNRKIVKASGYNVEVKKGKKHHTKLTKRVKAHIQKRLVRIEKRLAKYNARITKCKTKRAACKTRRCRHRLARRVRRLTRKVHHLRRREARCKRVIKRGYVVKRSKAKRSRRAVRRVKVHLRKYQRRLRHLRLKIKKTKRGTPEYRRLKRKIRRCRRVVRKDRRVVRKTRRGGYGGSRRVSRRRSHRRVTHRRSARRVKVQLRKYQRRLRRLNRKLKKTKRGTAEYRRLKRKVRRCRRVVRKDRRRIRKTRRGGYGGSRRRVSRRSHRRVRTTRRRSGYGKVRQVKRKLRHEKRKLHQLKRKVRHNERRLRRNKRRLAKMDKKSPGYRQEKRKVRHLERKVRREKRRVDTCKKEVRHIKRVERRTERRVGRHTERKVEHRATGGYNGGGARHVEVRRVEVRREERRAPAPVHKAAPDRKSVV